MELSPPPNGAPQQCVAAFSHHAVMGVYDADGNVIEMPSLGRDAGFSDVWDLFTDPTGFYTVFCFRPDRRRAPLDGTGFAV